MRFSNEQMAALASQVFHFLNAASAPKAVAEKPKRRGNPEALAKARAVKAANAKKPAKPAAASTPKAKGKVKCVAEAHVSKRGVKSVLVGPSSSKYQRIPFHSVAEFRQFVESLVDRSDSIEADILKHCR